MGRQLTLPNATGVMGYPANGDANYAGLCSFACNYGYCPSSACSTTKVPPYIPTTSPFNPPACTGGHGDGGFAGLCSFACNYGYRPIHTCTCTSTGALVESPPTTDVVGSSIIGPDNGLCAWACSHGYCPSSACSSGSTGSSGSLVPTGWYDFCSPPHIPLTCAKC
jgi:hypothetical protein